MYNKKTQNILVKTSEYLLVLILFFSTSPYFTWGKSIYNYMSLLLILIPLLLTSIYSKFQNKNIIYSLLFGILFFWSSALTNNILASVFYFTVPFYLLSDIKIRSKILDMFILKFFPLVLFISFTSYLFVGLNIIDLPTFNVEQPNALKLYDYTSHVFFLQPSFEFGVFNKFLSLYEEPGTIGTFCGIILFFFNKKMTNKVFYIYMITGILTFSFFFILIMLFFFILSPLRKVSNKFNLKYIIFLFIIILLIIKTFDFDFIQKSVLNRFVFEGGKLMGDNRNSAEFDYYFWNTYIYSPDLYFGTKDTLNYSEGSFSIHKMIYLNGLILTLITSFLYLSYFNKYKESRITFVIYTLVYFSMIYQRPYLWNIFYFILFTTVLESNFYSIKGIKGRLLYNNAKSSIYAKH